jgi:hypothetical protein
LSNPLQPRDPVEITIKTGNERNTPATTGKRNQGIVKVERASWWALSISSWLS